MNAVMAEASVGNTIAVVILAIVVLGVIVSLLSPVFAVLAMVCSVIASALGVVASVIAAAVPFVGAGFSALCSWFVLLTRRPVLALLQLLRFALSIAAIAAVGWGVWCAFHWRDPAAWPHWRTVSFVAGGVALWALGVGVDALASRWVDAQVAKLFAGVAPAGQDGVQVVAQVVDDGGDVPEIGPAPVAG